MLKTRESSNPQYLSTLSRLVHMILFDVFLHFFDLFMCHSDESEFFWQTMSRNARDELSYTRNTSLTEFR